MTNLTPSRMTDAAAPPVHPGVIRQHIPCNTCGSMENTPFCPENERGLVKCSQCGLVYVSPRPDVNELYALYGETYFHNDDSGTVGYTNYIRDEANIRQTFARRLARIERFLRGSEAPRRVMDVGCATGFFLSVAQEQGWNVDGIDISHFAVDYARQRFGFNVQQGSLLELDYPENAYDLITMWDVIEHVPDPKAYIERAAQLLKPGGMFALATPDVDSIPARMTGKRWIGYKLSEEHVYYFSLKTLTRLLNDAGFDVVDHYPVGKFVTMRLLVDRIGKYSPALEKVGAFFERTFKLSKRSLYVNPFDIICVTARKR